MVVASTSELKLNLTLNRMIKSILFPDFLELIIVIQGPTTSCIAGQPSSPPCTRVAHSPSVLGHLLVICHLVLWQLVLWLLKLRSPCQHAVCQTCFFHFFHIFYLVISKAVVFTCFVKNSFLMLKAVEELLLYLGCHYSCKPFCIT